MYTHGLDPGGWEVDEQNPSGHPVFNEPGDALLPRAEDLLRYRHVSGGRIRPWPGCIGV